MQEWWEEFTKWCSEYLPLGSWADWFAAIGTVGALLWGVGTFAHSRALARRHDADAVVSRVGSAWHGTTEVQTVSVRNTGSRPIIFCAVMWNMDGSDHLRFLTVTRSRFELEPGEVATSETDAPKGRSLTLVIVDSTGRRWYRDLTNYKYIRGQRKIRKIGGGKLPGDD